MNYAEKLSARDELSAEAESLAAQDAAVREGFQKVLECERQGTIAPAVAANFKTDLTNQNLRISARAKEIEREAKGSPSRARIIAERDAVERMRPADREIYTREFNPEGEKAPSKRVRQDAEVLNMDFDLDPGQKPTTKKVRVNPTDLARMPQWKRDLFTKDLG